MRCRPDAIFLGHQYVMLEANVPEEDCEMEEDQDPVLQMEGLNALLDTEEDWFF